MTLSIMALNIMTLSIMALSINGTQHNNNNRNAQLKWHSMLMRLYDAQHKDTQNNDTHRIVLVYDTQHKWHSPWQCSTLCWVSWCWMSRFICNKLSAECRYAECRGARNDTQHKWRLAQRTFSITLLISCHYAEFSYDKCNYALCLYTVSLC
jgi:hypothetical protein